MRAAEIVGMVPDDVLEFLSTETKTDYKVHKLKGKLMFKLLLYSLVSNNTASLRVLESVFHSYSFKASVGIGNGASTRFSSIRDRIATIKPLYFEKLFHYCIETFSRQLKTDKAHQNILRFDSTMIAISAKLLSLGMKVGSKTEKKQVKCTIGFDGLLPRSATVFTQQQHLSEDICLYEQIKATAIGKNDIVVFDRGLKKRSSFADLSSKGTMFVTRVNPGTRVDLISEREIQQEHTVTGSLVLEADQTVCLYGHNQRLDCPFRLIKARIAQSGELILFLTNIMGMGAGQITEIYKKRWDIEVFFKFLKQELDLEHVLVRTENGLLVNLYAKLIAAILLTAYQQLNKLKGYKLVKLRFAFELEEDLVKHIVIMCGGDPEKMYKDP